MDLIETVFSPESHGRSPVGCQLVEQGDGPMGPTPGAAGGLVLPPGLEPVAQADDQGRDRVHQDEDRGTGEDPAERRPEDRYDRDIERR
jgi:hypothetical protein